MERKEIFVPESELLRQRDIMHELAGRALGLKYHIVTLGCQMNARDSETIAGMFDEMGFSPVETREEADIVLYNTCCVRENAENKALGNVIWLKELKREKPDMLICVGGCMMQEPGVAENIKKTYPFVDVVMGTHNVHELPELIRRRLDTRRPAIRVVESDGVIAENLPEHRTSRHHAFVNIMYGCNNFCSYCIVPYVRGRERSRAPEAILDECKRLVDNGAKEIMLLGQNVNSYQGGGGRFAELLYRVEQTGVERIRFMTSHPKDISDELIDAYRTLKHLMPQLHLPVQAGDNEILRQMNRIYTREKYFETVQKLRSVCPDVGLTTDLIVGFPGETEEQFAQTMSLVEQVRYDAAYTFIYSPRIGTRAAQMPDPVSMEEKSARIQKLIALQQSITTEVLQQQIGRVEAVLVDSASARDTGSVSGKTPRGHQVNFKGDETLIGSIVNVKIESAGRNTLRGSVIHG